MIKVFLRIILLLSLSFYSSFGQISNEDLLRLARQKIPNHIPRFPTSINCDNDGPKFELQTALLAQDTGEDVYGFGLDIIIRTNESIFVFINGIFFQLKDTEYDVITKHFVIECKSTKNPKKYTRMKQLLKERNMLMFLKKIYKEAKEGTLKSLLSFNKKKHSILTINGESTNNQNVPLMSKWITGSTLDECKKQWCRIIEFLSNKTLVIIFKNIITPSLAQKLKTNGLRYKDNVDIDFQNYINKMLRQPNQQIFSLPEKKYTPISQAQLPQPMCLDSN